MLLAAPKHKKLELIFFVYRNLGSCQFIQSNKISNQQRRPPPKSPPHLVVVGAAVVVVVEVVGNSRPIRIWIRFAFCAGAGVVVSPPPRIPPARSRIGVPLVEVIPSKLLIWFWICPMMTSSNKPLACSSCSLLGKGLEDARLNMRIERRDSFIIICL